jgi:ribose transport system ATP-binding protein
MKYQKGIDPQMTQTKNALKLVDITKRFPGSVALDKVSLTLKEGEILGLVGENGAGKSTLVKIITGLVNEDEGAIYINDNDKPEKIRNPNEAIEKYKISYVSQESVLCSYLTVAENIGLGRWEGRKGLVNWRKVNNFAKEALENLKISYIDPTSILSEISPAERQLVEIARALAMDSKILLLDEPTSWLSEEEKKALFERMVLLKEQKVSVIFISHFLDEVLSICDRIEVLREGNNVGTFKSDDLTKDDLIEKMLGHKQKKLVEDDERYISEQVLLQVKGLTKEGYIDDVSFDLHKGEIVGITGLLGSGTTELARMLFGLEKIDKGEVYINGNKQIALTPKKSNKLGLGFITKDRKEEGITPLLPVYQNITLANLKDVLTKIFTINIGKEKQISKEMVKSLDIRPGNVNQEVVSLSGGNQQKVILAKWLHADSEILIFDEPTRGIDIGAKYEIYALLKEQAKAGKAVIIISSELSEILELPDRFFVMSKGKIIKEYKKGQLKNDRELLAELSV